MLSLASAAESFLSMVVPQSQDLKLVQLQRQRLLTVQFLHRRSYAQGIRLPLLGIRLQRCLPNHLRDAIELGDC